MAASSLLRLVVVVLILITLALTSSMAWGSFATTGERAVSIDSVQTPTWLDGRQPD